MSTMKPRSGVVTDGLERAPARGMLRAVGMGDQDWVKPQIGIASSWNEITPCNLSLDRLAKASRQGVIDAGGFPMQFGTISVSDGIAMGHEGMHFSLVSREIIADSVETVMQAERFDGMVTFAGCDKSLPGMMMAAAVANDGVMMEPYLVEDLTDENGDVMYQSTPRQASVVVEPQAAEELRELFHETVRSGTSSSVPISTSRPRRMSG